MTIRKKKRHDGAAVFEIRGTLLNGPQFGRLLGAIRDGAYLPNVPSVVLDLRNLRWINASGLSLLLEVKAHLARSGQSLALVAPTRHIRSILMLTRLLATLPCYRTVDEAAHMAA